MLVIKKSWFPSGTIGLGPILLARPDERLDEWTINYWHIIWKQQLELAIIGWLVWLILEKIIRLAWRKGHRKETSFFQEARDYQSNLAYPRFRPWWAWTKYIKT